MSPLPMAMASSCSSSAESSDGLVDLAEVGLQRRLDGGGRFGGVVLVMAVVPSAGLWSIAVRQHNYRRGARAFCNEART